MTSLLRTALLLALTLLAACQPAVRPTMPETAVVGPPAPATTDAATTTATTPSDAGVAAADSAIPEPGANASEGPVIPTQVMISGAEVFARINRRTGPDSCDAGSNSSRWRKRYAGHPVTFARRLESILPLLDFVSVEVERAGLPGEFVFVPLVESWYQPAAIGPGGPAGMWQMIGSTARNHGIHIRPGYDGRLSPVESTRAALSYLKTLQGMFNDWQAIAMAYNAGEGRLRRAFQRANNRTASGTDRRPHGLSNITYDYIAKLQALSCLLAQPERHDLRLPVDTRFEPLVPLLMDAGVHSLDEFARANGKDAALLKRMNPGFRHGRVVAGVPRLVLSPPGTFLQPSGPMTHSPAAGEEVATSGDGGESDSAPTTHKVRTGESLWTIARIYRVSIEHLRRANGLGSKSIVRPGQLLRLTR